MNVPTRAADKLTDMIRNISIDFITRFATAALISATLTSFETQAQTPGVITLDPASLNVLASDIQGPEGPSVLPDGSVAAVEFVAGNVWRVHPDGQKELLASIGSGAAGTALGKDGALYVVKLNAGTFLSRGRPQQSAIATLPPPAQSSNIAARPTLTPSPAAVIRIDLKTKQARSLYTQVDGKELATPDDLVIDRWGDIWFTDIIERAVYWARSDGSVIRRVIDDAAGVNGIALSRDQRLLYIIANDKLVSYRVTARGTLAENNGTPAAEIVAGLDKNKGVPDGMKTDARGNILLACGEDGVLVYSPTGQWLSQVKIAGKRIINMAFTADERTLIVAANPIGSMTGALLAVPWIAPNIKF